VGSGCGSRIMLSGSVERNLIPPRFPRRSDFSRPRLRPIPGLFLAEQYLHLPPVHLVGIETVSVNCAQRFAILYASHLVPFPASSVQLTFPFVRFPEMVLSLTLINVPPPTEYEIIRIYASTTSTNRHPRSFDDRPQTKSEHIHVGRADPAV
jgi:hypothetical protein